jgi:hypothetical protein
MLASDCYNLRMSRSKFVGTRIEETTLAALDRAAQQAGYNKAHLLNIILVRRLAARGDLAEDEQEVLW